MPTDGTPTDGTPSLALLSAQARLLARRQQEGIIPQTKAPPTREEPKRPLDLTALPAHLGWGCERLTAVLRAKRTLSLPKCAEETPVRTGYTTADDEIGNVRNSPNTSVDSRHPKTLRLYPTFAMACLKAELVAPARVWLLCRLLDGDGRGWLELAEVRHALTCPQSQLKLCGKRQLRNLLHAGEGIFWHREGEKLWLQSLLKVADALDMDRFTGRPINLPVSALLGPIQGTRAHFYASFHSGRPDRPIARETMRQIGGLSADSQRRYEQVAGIKTTPNYAIGAQVTPLTREQVYGQRGYSAFELLDVWGKHGRAGTAYMAWQLPNSYSAVHETINKGNQRRINRQLTDLSMKGMTGNGGWIARRFYGDGKSAARTYNRQRHEQTIYWPQPTQQRRQQLWYALNPQ